MTNRKGIPEGFHTATPYLMVRDIERAIAFYKAAFGATVLRRTTDDSGKLFNAEVNIVDSPVMIGSHPEINTSGGQSLDDLPRVSIYLYVEDADAVFRQALTSGAKEIYAVRNMDYGNREGGLVDPFGIVWWVATLIE